MMIESSKKDSDYVLSTNAATYLAVWMSDGFSKIKVPLCFNCCFEGQKNVLMVEEKDYLSDSHLRIPRKFSILFRAIKVSFSA